MNEHILGRQRDIRDNIAKQFSSNNIEKSKTSEDDFFEKGFQMIIDHFEKAKPGDTKMGSDGKMREWVEYLPGKWDWRKVKGDKDNSDSTPHAAITKQTQAAAKNIDWDNPSDKIKKLLDFAKKTPKEKLLSFARKRDIDPELIAVAKKTLKDQGVDESEFEYKKLKVDDEPDVTDDLKNPYAHLLFRDKHEEREDPIKRVANYRSDVKQFIKQPNTHLFIYGKGGAGKSVNLKEVMEEKGQKEFDPGKDVPGDKDYDWVQKGRVTLSTLMRSMYEHNGKMVVFDDSDGILENRDAVNILKLAMDDKKSRWIENDTAMKVMVRNPAYDPADPDTEEEPEIPMPKKFRFTGKIAFISNRPEEYFKENPDREALLTRGKPIELDFTNKEMLQLIHKWLQDGGIKTPGLEQLPAKEAQKEAEEIFDVVKTVLHKIPQGKLNGRTMGQLALTKRRVEDDNEEIETENRKRKAKGEKPEPLVKWDDEVVKQLLKKAEENDLEKASYDAELASEILFFNTRKRKDSVNSNELQKAYDALGI